MGPVILEVTEAFRDSSLRGGFIALLREAEPFFKLSRPSFLILLDLLRVCLKESGSNSNYAHMQSIHNLSFQYGATVCGHIEFVGCGLQGNEHWDCAPFWLFCLEEWVRFDVLRFSSPSSATRGILDVSDTSFIAALTIIRMQTIATESMRAARVSSHVIEEFINTASALHGLSGAHVDMLRRPTLPFIAFIQDTITERFGPTLKHIMTREKAKAERRAREASNPRHGDDGDAPVSAVSPRRRRDSKSAQDDPPRPSYAWDIGFCPLIELIYVLVNINYWCDGSGAYLREYNKICVCNSPIEAWEVVGSYCADEPESEFQPRCMINRLLCETCYRRMTDPHPVPQLVSSIVLTGVCVLDRSWEPLVAPVSFSRIFFARPSSNAELPDESLLHLSFDPLARKIVRLSIGHLARPSNLMARESLLEYEGLKLCSGAFAPGQFVRYLNLKSPSVPPEMARSEMRGTTQGLSGGLEDRRVRSPVRARPKSSGPSASAASPSDGQDDAVSQSPGDPRDSLNYKRDQKKK
jgi:hypothetical protein